MGARFVQPTSVAEASELLAADSWGATAISGGTAVVLMMRQGLIRPDTLVSLAGLEGLGGIRLEGERLRIGAGVPLSEVAASPEVRATAPSLATACGRVGNVRVRNVATLGGNVAEADYASDPPSVLVSLDASCRVVGPDGEREVPVADLLVGFYTTSLQPGEVITEVIVPRPAPGARSTYLKYISRSSEDRPCVGVAAHAVLDAGEVADLRVAVGAVAETPQRLDEHTTSVRGRALTPEVAAEVAAAYAATIEPMDDARGSAWYRSRMIEVFVRRAITALAAQTSSGRGG